MSSRSGSYSALRLKVLLLAVGSARIRSPTGSTSIALSYCSVSDGVAGSGVRPDDRAGRGRAARDVIWMHGTHDARGQLALEPRLARSNCWLRPSSPAAAICCWPPISVGLGVSKGPQTYFVNTSTVDVTLDLLRAAKDAERRDGPPLEREPLPHRLFPRRARGGAVAADAGAASGPRLACRGQAGIAGPYRLADISFPFAFERPLARGLRLSGDRVAVVFHLLPPAHWTACWPSPTPKPWRACSTAITRSAEIAKAMPATPRTMFTPEVLAAFDGKGSDWFVDELRANQIEHWSPRAPFRAYFGDNDVDVSPADARRRWPRTPKRWAATPRRSPSAPTTTAARPCTRPR